MAKINITVEEINDKVVWENFQKSSHVTTFLQSWNWGEVNGRVGEKIFRFGFFRNGKLEGSCLYIMQDAKRGKHLLIPGGPVIAWDDKSLVETFFTHTKRLAKDNGCWFVRMRPQIEKGKGVEEIFTSYGLVNSPMHVHGENTLVLNIDKNEDEILSGFRKTTRQLVKKSMKDGYNLEVSTNVKKIKTLVELQNETVKRHGFVGFKEKLFTAELEVMGKDNQVALFIVKKGSESLVAALIVFYGEKAFYHFSGSSEAARKTTASYFLQWQAIIEAKKRGLLLYDFWGIAPNDNPKHRFAGVTTFKKGFGGTKVDWIHSHDMPISPLYLLTSIFERSRKIFRRL